MQIAFSLASIVPFIAIVSMGLLIAVVLRARRAIRFAHTQSRCASCGYHRVDPSSTQSTPLDPASPLAVRCPECGRTTDEAIRLRRRTARRRSIVLGTITLFAATLAFALHTNRWVRILPDRLIAEWLLTPSAPLRPKIAAECAERLKPGRSATFLEQAAHAADRRWSNGQSPTHPQQVQVLTAFIETPWFYTGGAVDHLSSQQIGALQKLAAHAANANASNKQTARLWKTFTSMIPILDHLDAPARRAMQSTDTDIQDGALAFLIHRAVSQSLGAKHGINCFRIPSRQALQANRPHLAEIANWAETGEWPDLISCDDANLAIILAYPTDPSRLNSTLDTIESRIESNCTQFQQIRKCLTIPPAASETPATTSHP